MFKTLITTCLLTFSSCTGIGNNYQHKETRNNAVETQVKLNGYYNFKDTIRFENQSGTLNLVTQSDGIKGYCYVDDWYYEFDALSIEYSFVSPPNYSLRLNIHYFDELDDSEWKNMTLTSTGTDGNFQYLSSYSSTFKNFIMYFGDTYFINSSLATKFDLFFTTENNAYIETYNGYYNLNSNYVVSEFFLMGNFIVDNVLYLGLCDDDSGALMGVTFESADGYTDFKYHTVKTSSYWSTQISPKNANIYFNCLKLPSTVKDQLENSGIFAYIQPTFPSAFSFQDFFFGIADTPLYYAWSLLNWDLFGLNLFVAFCGLCTLALIVFVIKKLI